MSKAKWDPAFPVKVDWTVYSGMSRREYFAGQALTGLLVGGFYADSPELGVKQAYKFANAMLEYKETK